MSALFAEDVAEYLKNNPGFFEQYADLISQIFVSHPHGGRAVSLAERQCSRCARRTARRKASWPS